MWEGKEKATATMGSKRAGVKHGGSPAPHACSDTDALVPQAEPGAGPGLPAFPPSASPDAAARRRMPHTDADALP